MSRPERTKELGRGERVLPGIWRLRLPLPWPGVPHCNAFAIASGDGVVLVDCGLHEPGSLAQLERALAQCALRLEDVRLLVCTHAHIDHYGQAASVVERAGCELWMHPDTRHLTRAAEDPEGALARRLEIGRQSGMPHEMLERYREAAIAAGSGFGVAGFIDTDRPLLEGTIVESDLGLWTVVETPGHAPSHVCLFEPQRRLLVTGDHLLGRVSQYYDYGWTPDPVGEFLESLRKVEALDARLCLAGHGRTFNDVQAHIEANRALVGKRLERALAAVTERPLSAFEVVPMLHDSPVTPMKFQWWMVETLSCLRHLEVGGYIERTADEGEHGERWSAVS